MTSVNIRKSIDQSINNLSYMILKKNKTKQKIQIIIYEFTHRIRLMPIFEKCTN